MSQKDTQRAHVIRCGFDGDELDAFMAENADDPEYNYHEAADDIDRRNALPGHITLDCPSWGVWCSCTGDG